MNLMKKILVSLCILFALITTGCDKKLNESKVDEGYAMWQKISKSDLSMTNSNFIYTAGIPSKNGNIRIGIQFKSDKIYGVQFSSNGKGEFYFNNGNGSLYNHVNKDGIKVSFDLGSFDLSKYYSSIIDYNNWKIMTNENDNLLMIYCPTSDDNQRCINIKLVYGDLSSANAQTDNEKFELAKEILDCIEIHDDLSYSGIDYYYQYFSNPLDLIGDQSVILNQKLEKSDGSIITFGINSSSQYISSDGISYVNSFRINGVDKNLFLEKSVDVYEYFVPDNVSLEDYKKNKMADDDGEYIGKYTSKNGITFEVYRFDNINSRGENDQYYYKLVLNTKRNSYLVIYQNWGTSLLGYLGVTGEVEANVEYFSEIFTVNN